MAVVSVAANEAGGIGRQVRLPFGNLWTRVSGHQPRIWEYKAAAIASIDRLKRAEHKRFLLESRKWDLIIFDEAHRLSAMNYGTHRVERTQNYRLAEEIRHKHYCEAFLLLTAMPHQGEENHSRFTNLVSLLDDNVDFTGLENVNLFSGQPEFT
jgi:superfamily II DNA or RNA helicase